MAKILLSLPDQLLTKLDSYCATNHFERSEMVRSVLRTVLGMDSIEEKIKTVGVPRGPKEEKIEVKDTKIFPVNNSIRTDEMNVVSKWWACEHGGRGRTCKNQKCRDLAIKKGDV